MPTNLNARDGLELAKNVASGVIIAYTSDGPRFTRDRFQVFSEARIIDLGMSYGRRQEWQAEEDQEDPNCGVGHS